VFWLRYALACVAWAGQSAMANLNDTAITTA
jgi:hypothetical protein